MDRVPGFGLENGFAQIPPKDPENARSKWSPAADPKMPGISQPLVPPIGSQRVSALDTFHESNNVK